jgi:hypothetical protein
MWIWQQKVRVIAWMPVTSRRSFAATTGDNDYDDQVRGADAATPTRLDRALRSIILFAMI